MKCLLLVTAVVLTNCGCMQSLLEQRVIEQFVDAMDEENELALRHAASQRFEEKALRSEDALTDLRVVHLPSGKVSVVETEQVDDVRKRVIVKEESGGKYQFELFKDPTKNRWVVDDVMVRQRSKGTRVVKSTTEVMDLFVTLREFMDTWQNGQRDEILQMVTPELQDSLSKLPPSLMTRLTARVAAQYDPGIARHPEAQLNDDDAVLKLPSRQGFMLVKVIRSNQQWLVDDIEVINRKSDSHPGSIRRQSDALGIVSAFLDAYSAEDHEALKLVSDPRFYADGLRFADLSLLKLPEIDEIQEEFDIRAFGDSVTIMIPADAEILRVDLKQSSDVKSTSARERFIVGDVLLYERGSKRQRRLSSVFTAPAHAMMFLRSLQEKDIPILTQVCSARFSRSVWKRLQDDVADKVNIPMIQAQGLKLASSNTRGTRTDLDFETLNGQVISCVLINENGRQKVDDMLFQDATGAQVSLRTQLELAVPVAEFVAGWQTGNIERLTMASSTDFNRLVWSHTKSLPDDLQSLTIHLTAPIASSKTSMERATLNLGTPAGNAARISLVQEHDYWVVDEVHVPQSDGRLVAIRNQLRRRLASTLISSGTFGDPRSAGITTSAKQESHSLSDAGLNTPRAARPAAQPESPKVQQIADQMPWNTALSGRIHAAADVTPSPVSQSGIEAEKASGNSAAFDALYFGPDASQLSETSTPPVIQDKAAQVATPRESDDFLRFRPEPGAPARRILNPAEHPISVQ